MKIELPLETWTEVFGFVPRAQLVQLVPHIGDETRKTIGDRQFVSFVQFFLHKCGEVTLGRLCITDEDGPIVTVIEEEEEEGRARELPLADVPIPENVKNFKAIHLSNYDESVIAFLRKFQQNSLLDNVNLCFHDCSDDLLHIMTNFLPLFTNISSVEINISNSVVLDQLQSEYSELAIPMLTPPRILIADYNCRDIWFCDWLHIPREDGKPRVLILDGYKQHGRLSSLSHFIKHIKKDFLEANQAVSFFVILSRFRDEASVQFLTLENGQTQEKLAIKGITEGHDYVTITRYPLEMEINDEWGEEMKQQRQNSNRAIEFYE